MLRVTEKAREILKSYLKGGNKGSSFLRIYVSGIG